MSTDPRIEAAADAVGDYNSSDAWPKSATGQATAAVNAADKAATITTVEELEALPTNSVVLDRFDYPHHKYAQSKPDFKNLLTGHHITRTEFYLPARVLHFGGTKNPR